MQKYKTYFIDSFNILICITKTDLATRLKPHIDDVALT